MCGKNKNLVQIFYEIVFVISTTKTKTSVTLSTKHIKNKRLFVMESHY